jgi:DNA polymerase III subunit gamma/tau
MAYQSLYRKHRPQTFAEVVGQSHVTTALRNAVREGRVGHAYLFSGPRGTGKTTTARVLAKALNCLALRPDGEPCGVCENCVAIAEGRFLDLFELDAASNNSVDNIRDLTESVHLGLGPTSSRKIYIVDEVHMLSAAASNALLKTLEEPPEHVVFVLATTNPEKVLPTIRSRAQHFEFTLVSTDDLLALLTNVAREEGIEADPAALAVIARAGAGSARDALSLLDQALAHTSGGATVLDADAVADLFGGTPFDLRARILDAIDKEDAAHVLIALGSLLDAGHEPRRVAEDLLRSARDAFLLTAGGGRVPLEAPQEELQRLTDLGRSLGNALLVRTLETLGQAVVDMRGTDAADPRLVLEIALVRLTRRDAGPPLQTVIERIERLERAVGELRGSDSSAAGAPGSRTPGATVGALRRAQERAGRERTDAPVPTHGGAEEVARPPTTAPTEERGESENQASALDLDDVILAWADLLSALPPASRHAVQEAQPISIDGDIIVFGVSPRLIETARPRFRREADTIRDALSGRLGHSVRFHLVGHEGFSGTEPATAASAPAVPAPPPSRSAANEVVSSSGSTGATSPAGLIAERLGASVVEERTRE